MFNKVFLDVFIRLIDDKVCFLMAETRKDGLI